MKHELFTGCATALVTPFQNGAVDFAALSRIIDHQLDNAVSALVVCGTTGEPSTMSAEEQASVVSFVVEQVNGFIPVIAGTGGNHTAAVIQKARQYKELGADAQLCVTPYYNKTTQAGLIAHYSAIADAGDLPVILYNVPGRTGLNMLPETVARLSEHPNIVGHKEACADLSQASELFRLLGDSLPVYSGMDELILPLLALGARGAISVASNLLPRKIAELIALYQDGALKQSRDLQLTLLPFINALFRQTSPSPIKAAMQLAGLCTDEVRLPLIRLNDREREALQKVTESVL